MMLENCAASSSHVCLICHDESDGLHFGIYACRACTAFFRRTVVLAKEYVCRKGGNDCKIHKKVRSMCRKCRLRRCLDLGMLRENVQNRREVRSSAEPNESSCSPKPKEEAKPLEVVDSPSSSTSGTDSVNSLCSPSISASVKTLSPYAPELLLSIRKNYQNMCNLRRATELAMMRHSTTGLFEGDGTPDKMFRVSSKRLFQIHRAHIATVNNFIHLTFPGHMSLLTLQEQAYLLNNFVLFIWSMDSAYRTYKNLPSDQYRRKTLVSETTYIDMEHLEEFISDAPIPTTGRANLLLALRDSYSGSRAKVAIHMNDLALSEEEYCALLALTLWDSNIENTTESIELTSKIVRKEIYQQLHLYYRSLGLTNYAERMCNVLYLMNTILQSHVRLKQDIELFNLFDASNGDTFIYDRFATFTFAPCEAKLYDRNALQEIW